MKYSSGMQIGTFVMSSKGLRLYNPVVDANFKRGTCINAARKVKTKLVFTRPCRVPKTGLLTTMLISKY